MTARSSITLLVFLVALSLLTTCTEAGAGELETTRRAGDQGLVAMTCLEPGPVAALAAATGDQYRALAVAAVTAGRCLAPTSRIPATLRAWISGPHVDVAGGRYSVWRVELLGGVVGYTFVDDSGGRHVAARAL